MRRKMPYDPLENRIRKMVKNICSAKDNPNPFLCYFLRRNKKISYEHLWKVIILIIAIILCVLQSAERVQYFLSEPTVTDVRKWPDSNFALTYIHFEPLPVIRLLREYLDFDKSPTSFGVWNLLSELRQPHNLTMKDIWRTNNSTVMIEEISLLNKHGKKISSIKHSEVGLLTGRCPVIKLNKYNQLLQEYGLLSIEMKHHVGDNPRGYSLIMLHDINVPGSLKEAVAIIYGFNIDSKILSLRKYLSVPKRNRMCTDDIEYDNCFEKCLSRKMKSFINCSVLIYEALDRRDPCRLGMDFNSYHLDKLYKLAFSLDREIDCKCTKRCSRLTSKFVLTVHPVDNKETNILKIISSSISTEFTIVQERFSYDFVSLLCDIGGNLGLYLGWCVLSIFCGLQILFEAKMMKKTIKYFKSGDPIYRKVKKVFNQLYDSKDKEDSFKRFSFWIKTTGVPKCTAICISLLVFVYGTYSNINYYLSYPINTSIYIKENSTVQFPTVTICGDNAKILAKKAELKRKKTLPNYCNIQFLDLMEILSAENLWKISNFSKNWMDISPYAEKFVSPITFHKEIFTPYGICRKINSELAPYYGTQTELLFMFKAYNKCLNYGLQIIFEVPDAESDDIILEDIYPSGKLTMLHFAVTQIYRLNTPTRKCVKTSEAKLCKDLCIHQRINNIKCRLPYMMNISRPMCTTVPEAVEAQNYYIKTVKEFEYAKHCNCHPPCNNTVYWPVVFQFENEISGVEVVGLLFPHSVIEYFEEKRAVTIISLLCTIGNYLGLMLGSSLLSIFTELFSMLTSLRYYSR